MSTTKQNLGEAGCDVWGALGGVQPAVTNMRPPLGGHLP